MADITFKGECIGIRLIERTKKADQTDSPLLQFIIEDDGHWHDQDFVIDAHWLDELIRIAQIVKADIKGRKRKNGRT